MRRLPNTYPGDTTKYPNGRGTIGIGAADAGSKVLFYNETPVNLDLDFYNGDTDVLHAWEANFWTLDGEVSDITWAIDVDSLTVTNPPINAIFATIFNPHEQLNSKAYPMPLIRQIGGQQAIVSSASTVVNDGNALQQVIEATLQGHSSSDVIINNDGTMLLTGGKIGRSVLGDMLNSDGTNITLNALLAAVPSVSASGLVKFQAGGADIFSAFMPNFGYATLYFPGGKWVIQDSSGNFAFASDGVGNVIFEALSGQSIVFRVPHLAAVLEVFSNLVHVYQNMTIDGTSLHTGAATFTVDPKITSKKIADNSGNNLIDWSAAGVFAKGNPANTGAFHYQADGSNTDFQLTAISKFSGTGNGTFAHGLKQAGVGVTPDIIIPVQSVAGSQTMGYSALGATNVTITTGAGLAWTALAIKL